MKLDNRMLIIAATFGAAAALGACSSSDDKPSPVVPTVDAGATNGDPPIERTLRTAPSKSADVDVGNVDKPAGSTTNPPVVVTRSDDAGTPPVADSGVKPPAPADAGTKPPPPPPPTACEKCVASSCATESSTCDGDTNCACWKGCFDEQNLDECMQKCGVAGAAAMAFIQCRDGKCLNECSSAFDAGLPDLDGGFTLDGGLPFDAAFPLPDASLTPDAAIFDLDGGSAKECNACLASSCSDQRAACKADTDCACWQGCYDGSNWIACSQQCGAGNNAWFGELGCRFQSCSQVCR